MHFQYYIHKYNQLGLHDVAQGTCSRLCRFLHRQAKAKASIIHENGWGRGDTQQKTREKEKGKYTDLVAEAGQLHDALDGEKDGEDQVAI